MKMINTEKSLYIQEREVKPNRYASIVLLCTLVWTLFCWALNEIGIFRVGDFEMRVGCTITVIVITVPLIVLYAIKDAKANPKTKYFLIVCGGLFSLSVTTLLTFHTTMMLLFPIFIAMLYKSKKLGIIAVASAIFCTMFSEILSYMLGTWDIPLLQELILIGTNGTAQIVGAYEGINMVGIGKILLYLVLPRLLMVGSCSILMFYVIRVGADNVDKQITIHRMSYLDALTGLYNRNYYKEMIETEDLEGPVGVIFFDVNGLKEANDIHGHDYGDILLKRCAASISNICDNEEKIAFRMGGDEFLLIIDGANEQKVLNVIDQWYGSLNEVNRENKKHYNGMQCSVAIGYSVGDFRFLPELVRDADEAMYENKEMTKN